MTALGFALGPAGRVAGSPPLARAFGRAERSNPKPLPGGGNSMDSTKQNRREFLGRMTLGVAGAKAAISGNILAAPSVAAARGEMPYRMLGRSGEKVSLLGLGGYHIGLQHDEQESIRIIRTAIDN